MRFTNSRDSSFFFFFSINHVNILPLYGYFESSTDFNLVLEFAQVGDCYEKMSSLSRTASKKEYRTFAKTVLWQVCQAVAYLEQVSVAHRDIKPENIVVVDHTNTVKLADFGWACWFKPGQHHTTLCGTAEYLPPDLLRKSGYDASYVDRWMVGVLAVELMEGSTPFLYDVHGDEGICLLFFLTHYHACTTATFSRGFLKLLFEKVLTFFSLTTVETCFAVSGALMPLGGGLHRSRDRHSDSFPHGQIFLLFSERENEKCCRWVVWESVHFWFLGFFQPMMFEPIYRSKFQRRPGHD